MKSVTQNDIAKVLGLSQTTVALVVGRNKNHRGRSKLSAETVRRIQDKAKELGYRPNRFAQTIRNGTSSQIGIIYRSSQLQVANERTYYTTCALADRGYEPVLYDECCYRKGLRGGIETLLDSKVSGIILSYGGGAFEDDRCLDHLQIPLVGLSATKVGNRRLVRCDMRDGMLQIFRHLIAMGCRRFMHITLSHDLSTYAHWPWQQKMQAEGIRQGVGECGGTFMIRPIETYATWYRQVRRNPHSVHAATFCSTPEIDRTETYWQPYYPGVAIARKILNAGAPLPDAVICPNDDWAFGVTNEFMRAGVEVPKQVAVTGFNDSSMSDVFAVPFTTVRQPTGAMCRLAVDLLVQEIHGVPSKPDVHMLPGELIVRDSSRFGCSGNALRGPLNAPGYTGLRRSHRKK